MSIQVQPKKAKETKGREYLVRFVFGGVITAIAGWVATKFGPAIGGLLLGFPAILPASITLVQKHEDRHKDKRVAKDKAGEDSLGATLGSLGLISFGLFAWLLLASAASWLVLTLAFLLWLLVSVAAWFCVAALQKRARGRPAKPGGGS